MTTFANKEPQATSGQIEWSEWLFVLLITTLVLIITGLPYVYAYLSAPADKQYMGIMLDVADHTQYFSWMRELSTANLASNKLTPEPNAPVFFNLLWWLMGHAAHLLNLDYATMFQVLRVLVTVAFLPASYWACAWFLPDRLMRRIAFLTILLSAGFGWLVIVAKYLFHINDFPLWTSLLVYIVEPNTFLAILSTPHLVGSALYIVVFLLVLKGETTRQWRYAVGAGLFAAFIGWQHAYDLILVYGILGVYGLLKWARDRRLPGYLLGGGLIVGVLSSPAAIYSVLLTRLDPVWRNVLSQYGNAGVFTPNPLLLPVLMGPALLLALYATLRSRPYILSNQDDKSLFLNSWFWANLCLLYIPTDYQIKMLNGWQIPIAILATQGLFCYILPKLETWRQRRQWNWSAEKLRLWVGVGLVLVIVPTNLYLWTWRFVDLGRHDYPYYLTVDEVTALKWLNAHVGLDDVILSSEMVGQYVPMFTGSRAFLAHWAQTVDYYGKVQMVDEIFGDDTSASAAASLKVLKDYSVDYVYYGPTEQTLGSFQLATSLGLTPVFTTGNVTIYKVPK